MRQLELISGLCCVMRANIRLTVPVVEFLLRNISHYKSLQMADVFSWVCPCIAKSLPFADCLVLSSDSLLNVSSTSSMSAESTVFPTLPRDLTHCNLQIAHLNCRSLIAHIDDILALARELAMY